jgi:hypothetical protein
MAEDLASVKTKVASVIQDTPGFLSAAEDGEIEMAIREAIERYSSDAPREVIEDVAGDGTTYDLALTEYVDGARIITVEYPAGERTPLYIDGNHWTIYRTETTTSLRLLHDTPGSGETVRVLYTTPHTLDGLDGADATTIPARHTWAFVNLVAAHCMFRFASRFLHEQESTLNADSVDRGSKPDEARRIGGALLNRYKEQVGVASGEAPTTMVLDWDLPRFGGIGALTHRGRHI